MAMYGLYREMDRYPASERDSRLADFLDRVDAERKMARIADAEREKRLKRPEEQSSPQNE